MILDEMRKKLTYSLGISFETISCSGPNAAIIHYAPTKEKSSYILPE